MNILYVNWKCFGAYDMVEALRRLRNDVWSVDLSEKANTEMDDEFVQKLCLIINHNKIKVVISFNYFPSISQACMKEGCRYFAWIYDSPYVKAYDASITNNVNYIGTFDSFTANELKAKGVSTIHYLPLAVNIRRMEKSIEQWRKNGHDTAADAAKYRTEADITFVGSLYNDKNNFYERLFTASKDMELIGYLDGIIDAQRKIYGYNFVEECLSNHIMEKIKSSMPYKSAAGSYIEERRIYADYYIGPRITFLDRSELIACLARRYSVEYYTYTGYRIEGAVNRGRLDYYEDMPTVFHSSKINLNITLRSIRTGIPLRAMDIMGTGGFLLTNYQEDMFRHFVPDKHFVFYTSMEEAVDKAGYYIKHEEERRRIAMAAFEEMKRYHSYESRLSEVLSQL